MTFRTIFSGIVQLAVITQIPYVLGAFLVQDLEYDLTILTDNDLVGNTTTRTTGAILLGPQLPYRNADQACATLNEKLWSPQVGDFHAGLNNSLSYHVYSSKNTNAPSGLYWISRQKGATTCTAISAKGNIEKVPCDKSLPALCTQSAPMAYPAWANTSSQYQVSQTVGKQVLTGFRDFHTFRFHGIRFAPKPKRFELSTLYEGNDHADATKYGYDCVQAPMPYLGTMSEDCLFLNVWTPYLPSKSSPSDKKKLKPVLFWIYGGGNVEGSGTDPEKEGGQLASRGDVVVVEFSYRLGALGWMAFNDGIHNGNYGLSDQLNALKWTHKYISALGGDPERITIFGESAGANGVRSLLASPLANNLFSGALLQSVPAGFLSKDMWSTYARPAQLYEEFTTKVLAENGCANVTDEVACLRAGDPHVWAEPGRTHPQFHSRDGKIIPYNGLPLSGPLAKPRDVAFAIGTTRDEGAGSVPYGLSSNFTQLLGIVASFLDVDIVPLAKLPLFNPELSPGWSELSIDEKTNAVFNATQRIATEGAFTCLATAAAYSAAKNRLFKSVYQFQFNRTYVAINSESTPETQRLCGRFADDPDHDEYYKCHATENPVVFGNPGFLGWPDRHGKDIPYARLIVDYWSSFARTGTMDPGTDYLKARGFWSTEQQLHRAGIWKQYDSGKDTTMSLQWLGQKMFSWNDLNEERCQSYGYPRDYYENVDFEK